MGVFSGPELVTAGLVFGYDSGSVMKSWRGPPATNLFTETNLNNWSKSATVATSNFVAPFDITTYLVEDDNASAWESIDRNVTVPNDSASYTLSLFVRKTYGGVSARLGFNSGFNTGGTTVAVNQRFNSDTGVATNGIVIDYGDWWYWYFTITNNSSGNTNLYCSFYPATGPYNSSDASSAVGTAVVGGFMLVAGSTAARFVAGARSNTQAILDLTSRNTTTAVSLTYAANGSFSFNGTTDYISVPVATGTTRTVCIVYKLNNPGAGWGPLWRSDDWKERVFPGTITLINSSGTYYNLDGPDSGSTVVHIAYSYNGTNAKSYRNGVLQSNITMNASMDSGTYTYNFGRQAGGSTVAFVDMELYNVQFYDTQLTDQEIQQNFNSVRSRFGI